MARAANIGTYPWKVPAELSPVCLIRISDANGAPIAPVYISIDSEPIVSDIPLSEDLEAKTPTEISIRGGPDVPVKLWLDDVEVKFIDQSSGLETIDNAAYKPVLRDHFGRYESLLFPDKGGWRWVLESPDEDRGTPNKANLREKRTAVNESSPSAKKTAMNGSAVDESEFVSSAKSFRLENEESAPAVVSKRISLPARIPYVVSADNFSIVAGDAHVQVIDASAGLPDTERGGARDRGKEGKENSRSSGRQRVSTGMQN